MEPENAYIGIGWGFPPKFNKQTRQVEMLTDEEDIKSSLEILLSTRIGERIMQPLYGCNLDEMVFEEINLTMKTYLKELVTSAILYFEPRIELDSVEIDDSSQLEGVIRIVVHFIVSATNSRYNFVFPYYKREAPNLSM
jgi:phage baseplate assembly protein W